MRGEILAPAPERQFTPELEEIDSRKVIEVIEEYQHALDRHRPKEEKEILGHVFDQLEEVGAEHHLAPTDYQRILTELEQRRAGSALIRGVRIDRVLPTLFDEDDLEVGYHGIAGKPYPNAASATLEGLRVSFEQGSASQRGMRSAIIFEADDVAKKPVPDHPHFWQVDGVIQPEDIKYLLLRLSRKHFPERRLNPEERRLFAKHPELPFVFRAFEKSGSPERH